MPDRSSTATRPVRGRHPAPPRYNSLYEELRREGKNLNSLVAWGHARAIQDLLERGVRAEYRLHHHPARPGQRRIQPGQLARPADEQRRPRQVRQARRGGQLSPWPERLLRQRPLMDDLSADLGERAGIAGLPAHLHPGAPGRVSRRGGGHGRGLLTWVPIWVNVLESCELPVMMMVPIRACSAGVSAGVST